MTVRPLALAGLCLSAATGLAQPPVTPASLNERVLVVYNAKVRASREVADSYVTARKIPAGNRCELKLTDYEPYDGTVTVPWSDFEARVKAPIRKCLERVGKTRILYIVFSYKTPFRLSSAPARYGVSLDQYIADIWGELGPATRARNPYYARSESRAGKYTPLQSLAAYRDQPGSKTIYSVWRLDAASAELAKELVAKAIGAEKNGLHGQGCFDRRFGAMEKVNDASYGAGDWDIHRAAEAVRAAGFAVTEDAHEQEFGTPPAPVRCEDAAFYAGWYSLDHYNDAFTWQPGAIGIHLDSASAAHPREGTNWSANALKKGITVTAGAITEPDLFGLPHPDGIFRDLLAGSNAGDAFLRNTLWLRWMILQIGDPLYRPSPVAGGSE